ncbi:unnamed protein product [Brassica rapa]|uniref:C-JID domain-containing protein n=1 Tax=Brassica campestris TaxID=3711 RepID=A0A8D9I5D4_BRACM|nr:unnamed protein product [Brassica rapa]
MVLRESWYLKEIPDLTNATSLEELVLHGSEGLLELTSTIGNATKLKRCDLSRCFLLKELPSSMGNLINLEKLDLSACTGLKELSGCSSLKTLDLRGTPIWEVPSSIRSNWPCLRNLDMSLCRNLKEFPLVPDSIVELDLFRTRIKKIPAWIKNLSHLRRLTMYRCEKLRKISRNVSKLENLKFLGLLKTGESEYDRIQDPKRLEAVIEWGPYMEHSWKLVSDLEVHYILPRCLPAKALSLRLRSYGLNTIPDCITRLSGLTTLDVTGCRNLEALPPLPDSLLSIDAYGCKSLKRIDSSFQNPNSFLNFAGCVSLNQNAKELIYTSDCEYALLPGDKVPAHFPHQATSGSLAINQTPQPLPSTLRFKACVLLSRVNHKQLMCTVACHAMGKQNGFTIQYGSNQHHMPCNYEGYDDHLYIFEDSFCLNQDFPEAGEATLSELVFEFIGHGTNWKVKGCGVRLLFPDSIIVENAADDDCEEVESDDDGDEVESDESTLIPGVEVPAHFTYRATSGFLTINQNPQPLPPSLRFKACILLSRVNINLEDDGEGISWRLKDLNDEDDENLLMCVSCRFRGKQNGLTVPYGSKQRDMPYLYGWDDRLYTFEDSFCLDQDFPEAVEATFSELVFEFKVFYKNWKVKACGVQLLEDDEESGRDEHEDDEVGNGDNDGVEEEIQDDVDKAQQGEESRQEARNEGGSALCRYMKLSCCYIL